jgi:mRNA-degrading endonuclease RelE of RelBE toxin-antitoxin system
VKVTVRLTQSFKKAVKPLLKKYKSLLKDLEILEGELMHNPRLGKPLGKGAYKIRLKISSKGKGKSGGARVISLVENELVAIPERIAYEEFEVHLLTIYDKTNTENISENELNDLIKKIMD